MADLSHITTWVFDLDHTLYPAKHGFVQKSWSRGAEFMADFLGIDYVQAREEQTALAKEHGDAFLGLRKKYPHFNLHHFLDYLLDLDVSDIQPNPELDRMLHALPGRKIIYTDASLRHAEKVLDLLGVHHHFGDKFDLIAGDFISKAHIQGFEAFCRYYGVAPTQATMFEDNIKNLKSAAAVGMTTVYVVEEAVDERPDFVHYMTTDLVKWLENTIASLESGNNG